ncbi:MAG: phytoene desaturase [Candidatus Thermofonsia Clade 1 bacterium]|uniref:4,4'-diaponeurosporene oxygenase n=1 Tax=Candidatus Thermofonsia Clade 1 bacterium TaxID=2364210 RepID=A0A2M8PBY0_9CHLR|nr:MAG: phytoene desaturase [Candidatus Thermofonsia Clade 1 bacterium]
MAACSGKGALCALRKWHMADWPIVIVGGGIGGLSAAIHLAAAGERVLLFEQNAQVGGKMGELRAEGFRWDTGPSVITMPYVFDALFAAAGKRTADYLTLLPAEPLTRYFYRDGTVLDATSNLPRMLAQIAQIEPRDVEGYLAYLAYAARLHRITGKVFIYDTPPTLASLFKVPLRDALRVDAMRSMDAAIGSFVRSPHLRQLLGRFATYVGASPYRAPATLNVIAHVELNGGVYYPRGGIYAIARAMARLAAELGVEIQTGCSVERILVQNRRVRGVQVNGERIAAKAVIANVDVATVYEKLLPAEAINARYLQRLLRAEPSCSGYVLLLGVQGKHDRLAHHNIFFTENYRAEFADIFERSLPPTDPTVYVAITAKSEPEDAPAGMENWFVLINAPALSQSYDWAKNAPRYRDQVLQTLSRFGIAPDIRVERQLTPVDIAQLTGARRGALYGMSSNTPFAAFLRPHNRAPHVRGLYFAGGTAHPGGGVPMVTLSGGVAARLLLSDLSKRA